MSKRLILLLIIISAELLSFLGYYFSAINFIAFFAISLLAIILSLYKLEYGLWLLLTELFIGSFGYLFYFESGGLKISLRIALWLIILAVWLSKTILDWVKTKKLTIDFLKSNNFYYFLALAIFIAWGLLNGVLNKNLDSNIFQDFNNWLYLLLIFPIFSVLKNEKNLATLKLIFFTTVAWLSIKTLALFYLFSHDFGNLALGVYGWIRLNGIGEITQVQGGFNRIFMQSQIFVLIAFFILLFYLLKSVSDNRKNLLLYRSGLTLFLTAILVSFSRSFWLGLLVGGLFVWLVAIFKLKINLKHFLIFNGYIFISALASLALALLIVFFPWPTPYGGFNAANLLSDRATGISEAGASSRWQLLPPLWQKIKSAPLLGLGFGATVTYKSSDPRVLAVSPTGDYTTYAFEWGWLDVWLKLGVFGLLAYLALLIKIIYDGLKINSYFSLALATGLVILTAVNMFSPYINHPLGLTILMLSMALLNYLKPGLR